VDIIKIIIIIIRNKIRKVDEERMGEKQVRREKESKRSDTVL
jgi:hypothetical protein